MYNKEKENLSIISFINIIYIRKENKRYIIKSQVNKSNKKKIKFIFVNFALFISIFLILVNKAIPDLIQTIIIKCL